MQTWRVLCLAQPIALPSIGEQESARTRNEPSKKVGKTFDAATERVALITKVLTSFDKEVQPLLQIQADVVQIMDADFEASLGSSETPSSERDAVRLLKCRWQVSQALVGDYNIGKPVSEDPAIVEAEDAAYELSMKDNPAEVPNMFLRANCCSKVIHILQDSAESITSVAEKKQLEADFKPVSNLIGVMKTSLRTAFDKVKRMVKEKESKLEKERKASDAAAVKQLNIEKKKREAEEKKLSKAAEKQGKVNTLLTSTSSSFRSESWSSAIRRMQTSLQSSTSPSRLC